MRRRSFIQAGAAASALTALPRIALAQQLPYDPKPTGWRTFEITTKVELQWPQGTSRVWVPLPSVEGDYQKVIGNSWSGNASVRKAADPKYGAGMAMAEWGAGEKAPVVEVTSTFATRNRKVDFRKRNPSIKLDPAAQKFLTAPTELIPTDGIVRKINVLRPPRFGPETLQMAIDAVHRAAPFGDVRRMPEPWKFTESFLFDEYRRFKPRSLD